MTNSVFSDQVVQFVAVLWLLPCFDVAEKSQAFSPHGDTKKQTLGPDDPRTSNWGRPTLSPYSVSSRDMAKMSHDQHLLHFNSEEPFLYCLL